MNTRAIIIILGLLLSCTFLEAGAEDIIVSGIVKNKGNKKRIASVSLTVPGTNIGTVSNADGSFTLKVPKKFSSNGIKAEQVGFRGCYLPWKEIESYKGKDLTIWLDPSVKMLDEVIVYGADPVALIETAIQKIPKNYPAERNLFSSFYRETVKKGNRYIGVSEAIISILKTPYKNRNISGDRVKIDKGRSIVSQRSGDTLSVKVCGGPTVPILLDIVKHQNLLFNSQELENYEFRMEPMTSIDDRPQFAIRFKPKVKTDYPLYKGRIFIDLETTAFTKVEFALDVSDKEKVTRAILLKKPRGLRFKPQDIEFVATYKYQDGVSYLNYMSARTRFKCDWKRRLFSAGYTVDSELVMVDREDDPKASIPWKETFKQRDVFSDMVSDFEDADFWKDYNIIEPTESLEKAVLKLKNAK